MKDMREKILKTTFLLLIKKGYDGVSVSDIQKALGISRGLLYCYFKNKTELILESCKHYFFNSYVNKINLENITLESFIDHIIDAVASLIDFKEEKISILEYNTLYANVIMHEPKFKEYALVEYTKAYIVIRNAIKTGEVKNLPENFIGSTILSILTRTTYLTYTDGEDYVRSRIGQDLKMFYSLIKN